MAETRTEKLSIAKGLEIKASSTSSLGQIISYLHKMPSHNSELARVTLISRYLPFVLDPSDPHYRSRVLACAIECESWGRAIREYCGLPSASTGVHSYPLVSSVTPVTPTPLIEESNSVATNQLPVIESDEDLLNKFKQELQEIVDSASGAKEALEKLVELQPKQEEDWTEKQWDLWDEYSNKQQSIMYGQMFGDLGKTQKPATEK